MVDQKGLRVILGTTKFKAGIFLSGKIAERKPYYKALNRELFTSLEEAVTAFRVRYGDAIGDSKIKLNVHPPSYKYCMRIRFPFYKIQYFHH